MRTIPGFIEERAKQHPDAVALRYKVQKEWREATYRELLDNVDKFARGLLALGVEPGDRVFHLADNSQRWILADLGILKSGAVSVPRGADTTVPEAEYILEHSGATAVVVDEPKLLELLPDEGRNLKARIVLTGEHPETTSLAEVLELSEKAELPAEVGELATLVYTSGTTGTPKGVMLSHENILHNVEAIPDVIEVTTADTFLSLLPSWHMFERTVEYLVFASGATLSYSSLRTLKEDLKAERPTFLVAVPRLWESIQAGFYAKIEDKKGFGKWLAKFLLKRAIRWGTNRATVQDRLQDPRGLYSRSKFAARMGTICGAPLGALGKKIIGGKISAGVGGRLRGAISGGGMLALHLDIFLDALGLPIIVGYGLTETSPMVTIRRFEDNVLGTIGRPVQLTEIRVVGPGGEPLPLGGVGEVECRGPQVMLGYYKNEDATNNVMREGGWFRTGDLGAITSKGDIVFTGREKETIVLVGGENIEPYPIESRILECPLITQAMVVGQDRKTLAALIVPEKDRAEAEAKARGVSVEELLKGEVMRLVSAEAGFKARERIRSIAVLDGEFNIEDGTMTRTLKLKRNAIIAKYADEIDELYA